MNLILNLKKKMLIKRYSQNPYFVRFWEEVDLSKPIKECTFVVFDTETTGLNVRKAELVSLGAVKVVDMSIHISEHIHEFVRPNKLTPQSVEVHGITMEDLKAKEKCPVEVLERFLSFSKGAFLVGFNIEFDRRILEKYTRELFGIPLPNFRLDVFHLWKKPGREGKTLKEIASELEIPVTGLHSSLEDAYITALVFLKLVYTRKEEPVGSLPLML